MLIISFSWAFTNKQQVDHHSGLWLRIRCEELDWQLSSLPQVLNSSFPLISAVEELEIRGDGRLRSSYWKDDMEDTQWVEFLDPFVSLKNLYLMDEVARRVCSALQKISREMATEVLPVLRNLFIVSVIRHPGSHWAISCCTAALQSPCCCPQLGRVEPMELGVRGLLCCALFSSNQHLV